MVLYRGSVHSLQTGIFHDRMQCRFYHSNLLLLLLLLPQQVRNSGFLLAEVRQVPLLLHGWTVPALRRFFLPLIISVAIELVAMAEPHPNVLNFTSEIV